MSPGQELRAAREAMGLSLDEVAERTKIPARKTEWPTGRKLVSRNNLRKASK